MSFYRYSVFMAPLLDADARTYMDEIDVSDRVEIDGISNISKSIDASDYDVGVFVFSDLTLKGFNYNGYFNEEDDSRSIFKSTRDLCKVRVVFYKNEPQYDPVTGTILSEVETDTITFRGLINEEATRLDVVTESITFKVLSRDSVLRTTKVQGGTINNGMLTSVAMHNILNQPKITSVLTLNSVNINPDYDFAIDVANDFNDKSVKDALDELLLATNSVLLVDDAGTIIIQSRLDNFLIDTLNLYGKGDEQGRENIIDITAYNSGRQRMFTAFKINDTEVQNAAFVTSFGYRKKDVQLGWITDSQIETNIATNLVDEFKTPKIELNVKVSTDVAKDASLLDPVSISYPLRVKPIEGTFLPVIGTSMIDDAMTPLPYTFGAIAIEPRVSFKIISIDDNPSDFTSILKLRQVGKGLGDGVFDAPGSCRIDYASVGTGRICLPGDPCEQYNPSVIGAAQVGCTEVAA